MAPPPAIVAPATPAPVTMFPLKPPIMLGLKPRPQQSVAGSMRNARLFITRNSRLPPSVVPKKAAHGVVVHPVPALPVNPHVGGIAGKFCQLVPPEPLASRACPIVAAPEPSCAVFTAALASCGLPPSPLAMPGFG